MDDAQRQARNREALGQLVASAAHDFSNVLMVCESALALLEHPLDDATRERVLGGMRRALAQGGELTRRMRSFAVQDLRESCVADPNGLLPAIRDRIARSLREGVTLELHCDPGLPPVRVNAEDFELALVNLCRNAEDAMPGGGTIRVEARSLPEGLAITVADAGEGMSAEVRERAFEPFFTTKRDSLLAGLGLAQVYCFVLRSDGTIRIESGASGTAMRMRLPRAS